MERAFSTFTLSEFEEFGARYFRKKHRKAGCLKNRFFGLVSKRVLPKTEPTFTYIFKENSDKTFQKFIKCNLCGEIKEISVKERKKDR